MQSKRDNSSGFNYITSVLLAVKVHGLENRPVESGDRCNALWSNQSLYAYPSFSLIKRALSENRTGLGPANTTCDTNMVISELVPVLLRM